jgi:DNA polymerase-3 subunit gamma/tau
MVLVRIAYAADLPTPDEAIRALDGSAAPAPGSGNGVGRAGSASPAPRMEAAAPPPRTSFSATSTRSAPEASAARQPAVLQVEAQSTPQLRLSSFPEIVALAAKNRDISVKISLENDVRLVRVEDGRLEIALEAHASRSLVNELARKLEQWTGRRWTVIVSNAAAQPTLRAQAQAQQNELESAVQADPRVRDVMAKWPGAKLETVRRAAQSQAESDVPEPPVDDDED